MDHNEDGLSKMHHLQDLMSRDGHVDENVMFCYLTLYSASELEMIRIEVKRIYSTHIAFEKDYYTVNVLYGVLFQCRRHTQSNGWMNLARWLSTRNPSLIRDEDDHDNNGHTPWNLALESNQEILRHFIRLLKPSPQELTLEIQGFRPDSIGVLVEFGGDVNALIDDGFHKCTTMQKIIHHSSVHHSSIVLANLLQMKADPNRGEDQKLIEMVDESPFLKKVITRHNEIQSVHKLYHKLPKVIVYEIAYLLFGHPHPKKRKAVYHV